MRLEVEQSDGIQFIVPVGQMVAGDGDVQLREAFDALLSSGVDRIAIDFSQVPNIDSSVLGQLVHGYARLKENGSTLKLLEPTRKIQALLELTRLISVFEVFTDRETLIQSWSASDQPK